MKSSKILLILICLFPVSNFCFGQEVSKAVKIDEFGKVSCEDLWARLDSFFNNLLEESSSKGYVVINGKKNELMENLRYESWTNGVINFRNFDKNRIQVIRGKSTDNRDIQFWKIPIGAEEPKFTETEWNYKLPESTKPYIFTAYTYRDGLCPSTSYVKLFADFLIANPNARGHLVFRDKSNKNFPRTEKEVLDKLVNEYELPRNRLKLFYVEDKNYSYDFTDVEFWLVPKKQK